MSVRRVVRSDPKSGAKKDFYLVDVVFMHPDGQPERVRKVSPVQSRRGAEEYERKVRAEILNLLREARDALGLAAIYISHDLALIRYVCERTLVMYRGRVVEDGPTAALIAAPAHPYTTALVAAVPVPRVDQDRAPLPIRGSLSDAPPPPPFVQLLAEAAVQCTVAP